MLTFTSFLLFLPFCLSRLQVYFASSTETAITELNASIRRSLRAALRTVDSPPPPAFLTSHRDFLGAWRDVTQIPEAPFFTPEEEEYFVEQYKIQGFKYSAYMIYIYKPSAFVARCTCTKALSVYVLILTTHTFSFFCTFFLPFWHLALEFYTNPNRKAAYDLVQSQGNFTIPQPALHIAPTGVSIIIIILTTLPTPPPKPYSLFY